MSFDLEAMIVERRADRFRLFEQHLNPQALRVLRALGIDIEYASAEGAYLFDVKGQRYLDVLSGFGVFALGRNHPTVIQALEQVLREAESLGGIWELGRTLAGNLLRERAGAA